MARRADSGAPAAPGRKGASAGRAPAAARPPGPGHDAGSHLGSDNATGHATEPGTARALWPTFLRRTLAEDDMVPPRPALIGAE